MGRAVAPTATDSPRADGCWSSRGGPWASLPCPRHIACTRFAARRCPRRCHGGLLPWPTGSYGPTPAFTPLPKSPCTYVARPPAPVSCLLPFAPPSPPQSPHLSRSLQGPAREGAEAGHRGGDGGRDVQGHELVHRLQKGAWRGLCPASPAPPGLDSRTYGGHLQC